VTLQHSSAKEATLHVENVGGIDETTVTFSSGITILAGRNSTNRTSLLQALMAVIGSDDVSIKGNTDSAKVELTLGKETYTRTLRRENGSVTTTGSPFVEDSMLFDLFAALLESNEVRQAVTRDADLREFIMRSIDTDEIDAEIDKCKNERERIEQELDQISSHEDELPELKKKRTQLENQIELKRSELDRKEEILEEKDANVEQTRKEKEMSEEKLEEIQNRRSDLEDVRYNLQTERETLENLRTEKSELQAKWESLPDAPEGEIERLETRIDRLRTKKQTIEPQINELQSIITFNEELLNAEDHEVLKTLTDNGDEDLTDQLTADKKVTCWTCGTTVETDQISATLDKLRTLSEQKVSHIQDIDTELDELSDQLRDLEKKKRERTDVTSRLATLDTEIEDSEERIERLEAQRDSLREEIDAIEAEVEKLKDESYSEILELHRETNQLEHEIGKLSGRLEQVEDDIADVKEQIEARPELEKQHATVQDELEDLRTRIERIECDAIDKFNDHMDRLLQILSYEKLDRIWLEQKEREVREGRRKVTKNEFHLHVVRSTEEGVTYEDTVDHLSESEREITGVVFALTGYLVHDVSEIVPFMLLDSLEAIDSQRIATLVDYLSNHCQFLVAALLPEDATALDVDHEQITAI